MEYPEQLNNFCNYMSHLNRSVLTIEQYRTDLTMFFQYLRAGRISKVPTKEELDRQPIADFSVEELRAITGEDVFRFLRYVSEERGNKPAARARKLSAIVGVSVGIISAVKQYSIIDSVSMITAMLLTSIPAFWMGLMLILLFSVKLDWLPATGIDTWKHFILPSISVAINTMASLIRLTRSSMLEVIRADYIRTAKAKGATEKHIVFKHALRNALLPVITQIGINFGLQLGGAIVIEQVFAIPGLGTLMINSVRSKDTPMVMMSITFVAIAAGIVNLIVDLLYTFIDPRVKSSFVKAKS